MENRDELANFKCLLHKAYAHRAPGMDSQKAKARVTVGAIISTLIIGI